MSLVKCFVSRTGTRTRVGSSSGSCFRASETVCSCSATTSSTAWLPLALLTSSTSRHSASSRSNSNWASHFTRSPFYVSDLVRTVNELPISICILHIRGLVDDSARSVSHTDRGSVLRTAFGHHGLEGGGTPADFRGTVFRVV